VWRRQVPKGLALLALGFSGVVSKAVRDLEGVCGRRGRACEGGSGGVGSSRGPRQKSNDDDDGCLALDSHCYDNTHPHTHRVCTYSVAGILLKHRSAAISNPILTPSQFRFRVGVVFACLLLIPTRPGETFAAAVHGVDSFEHTHPTHRHTDTEATTT